jgi:hypothetical protein
MLLLQWQQRHNLFERFVQVASNLARMRQLSLLLLYMCPLTATYVSSYYYYPCHLARIRQLSVALAALVRLCPAHFSAGVAPPLNLM